MISIKRIQRAPQSQSGCEQSNIKYARYKTKHSNRMGIEMNRTRSRAGENGSPMCLFNAKAVSQYWRNNGHRYALTAKSQMKSKTLKKIQKNALERYTSRIFPWIQNTILTAYVNKFPLKKLYFETNCKYCYMQPIWGPEPRKLWIRKNRTKWWRDYCTYWK